MTPFGIEPATFRFVAQHNAQIWNILNFNGFISDGRFLIKLQVSGTALLKPVVKNFEKKKIFPYILNPFVVTSL